ncbi:MAG: tetratricopeptide repeat protein [Kouleothrix sp.]|nr:tetratricopeptide repeat protein [Kouleothrix sp.]
MTATDQAGAPPADYLRDQIAPELYAQLGRPGGLPEQVVRDECARLRAELAAIGTYIPSALVREQLLDPLPGRVRGAYWDGSVLFADLSGFTALSGTISALGKQGAEEISAIINNLFGALVEEIHRYRGGLLKFGGDAITAFFDAATLDEQHAALACRAALAMQERMAEFAALQTRAGVFTLRLRIGVHSGRVFAAQVGDAEHIELVATGRNINRVALAQEIAEPGQVVVSRATQILLPEATVAPRQSGCFLLSSLPNIAPPPPASRWGRSMGAGDLAELRRLAAQVTALRSYLPRGLPRRFLDDSGETESGEFRPVTVLFANFYQLSTALDVLGDDCESAARVLNAYYSRAQEVVHRYGGIVNKVDMYTFGDKLMALFGAPIAHEDDPLRAVRAALDLRGALDDANLEIVSILEPKVGRLIQIDRQFLKQRIGINTGVVFAGQVGSARRREYTVMGQHVNLAARLMSAAEEGAVVLSPATRRAVERYVALRELEPVQLKGIAEPVAVAQALRPLEIAQDARHGIGRAELVGRAREMELLIDEARAALAGGGRIVALAGEAGVGKTRLIEDALQRLVLLSAGPDRSVAPFFPYSVECQSYEQNTAYAGVRELLRLFFNLDLAHEPAGQLAIVSRRVAALAPELARFTPLLGDLLGLAFEETSLTAALTPQQRHDRSQELFEALILAEACAHPLILIVDDLHWADASSIELLARLARRAPEAALLLIFGYRLEPPIPEPWRELAHCARVEIRELAPERSSALLRALLRGEPPPELTEQIEKAQGNPFFVEEVVRGLVESGALVHEKAGWRLTRVLDETAVPDSIEGVITARLDRLEERSREVLQVAAVVGRRFLYPVLSGVVGAAEQLPERLRLLSDAELILPEEIERDLAYLFKHALTRDVAYEAILYARRRELHRRVARRIEELNPGRLDDQLALLARHYLFAEEWEPAFDYHLRAGRYAQARYANREAIALFERALQIATRGDKETRRRGDEETMSADLPVSRSPGLPASLSDVVELHERLGAIHTLIGEYDTALDHYQAALDLLGGQADAPIDGLVRLHHHIAHVYGLRTNLETALEWVERALTLAPEAQSIELARCLSLGAGLCQRQGRYQQAVEWGERALRLTEQLDSQRDRANTLRRLGGTYRNMGDNARALDLLSRCLEIYEQVHDLAGLADAHNDLANACYELGRLGEARAHYEAGAAIKEAIGDVYGQAMIANNLGGVLKLQDNVAEAITQYQRSLAIFERLGSPYGAGALHMNLGAVYLLQGDNAVVEGHLRRAAELFEQAGAEDFLPELERYIAQLHLRRGDLPRARLACELSLETALRLEARLEEGMTRRILAEIMASGGDSAGAWDELEHSLAILRDAGGPHEIARTLTAIAALAPQLGRRAAGQAAIAEALPALREVGARRDLAEARAVARRHNYTLSF